MKLFSLINSNLLRMHTAHFTSPAIRLSSIRLQQVLHPSHFPIPLSSYLNHDFVQPNLNCAKKFSVFLNFRGKDTRHSFVLSLYKALCLEGIDTFKDDVNLNKGGRIRQELYYAIKECRIAIVILSKNYATSTWCLDELVEIMKIKNVTLFPVFYDVSPYDVRFLRGPFIQAFAQHEINEKSNPKKVKVWKKALAQTADIAGFFLLSDAYKGDPSKCIQDIVQEVRKKLEVIKGEENKSVAGVEHHLTILNTLLKTRLLEDDVFFVGIWGLDNNTTILMKKLLNKYSNHFEFFCLLQVSDLNNKQGMVPLQMKLLEEISKRQDVNVVDVNHGMRMIKQRFRLKKVLVIFDGVNNVHQLRALAGSRDWFGPGSRIIITAMDKFVLIQHGMDVMYKYTR